MAGSPSAADEAEKLAGLHRPGVPTGSERERAKAAALEPSYDGAPPNIRVPG